ncbi:fructosamine kinase family protein [Paraliobacillus zengyii]|uniref:fructosamine kinase family protein n=1 Tax=Paraliobacillus zengyii TaxID=2213194 RepID=UPI001E3446FE|nr:fructosamine kinase family protein [Paraliobacillus zengyii]
MNRIIHEAIEKINPNATIETIRSISGGDINQAYRVETNNKNYFVKTNQHVPANFFTFEANGIQLIKNTNTIAVPTVHYYNEPKQHEHAILVMDWIEGKSTEKSTIELGEQVAALHQHHHEKYGLDQDGFIGSLAQVNDFTDTWISYMRDYRLLPQLHLANERGRLSNERYAKLEKLINHIDKWLPANPKASLLHGDLWGGNWLTGANGKPFLIDPAVFYGDHLFELAFTELFGGFPQDFYNAYKEVMPIEDYYNDVKPLYQLYYLLVHLTLFGEGYGTAVDRTLNRYV